MISDIVPIPDVLLKLNLALTHSLQSICFLDSLFLNKDGSTCDNIIWIDYFKLYVFL
jgi:hypothetical protein